MCGEEFVMKTKKTTLLDCAMMLYVTIMFFRPRSIELYQIISHLFYLGQCILTFALIGYVGYRILRRGIKRAFSPVCYLVMLYKGYETFAIYSNGLFEISTFINACVLIAATVFTESFLEKSPKLYLTILSVYTGILVWINNLSYFVVGSSSYTDATGNYIYFWSTKNHLSSLFFCAFLASLLMNGLNRTKLSWLWNIFVFINIMWGTIVFDSATTIVGIVVLLALYVLFKRKNVLYRPVAWFFGGLGVHVAIVIFRVQETFSWIIEHLLNKTLSFSGRTEIWDMALYYIYRKPLLGYGASSVFNFSYANATIPAHNQLLDIAVVCGIPGLIIFFVILLIIFLKLNKYKESIVARMVTCALLGYLVMMITESPNPNQAWFIIFGLIYRVPDIDRLFTYVEYSLNNKLVLRRKKFRGNLNY